MLLKASRRSDCEGPPLMSTPSLEGAPRAARPGGRFYEELGVPLIVSVSVLPNQHVLLNCLGAAGAQHRIQGATDLHTWSDLGTATAAALVIWLRT